MVPFIPNLAGCSGLQCWCSALNRVQSNLQGAGSNSAVLCCMQYNTLNQPCYMGKQGYAFVLNQDLKKIKSYLVLDTMKLEPRFQLQTEWGDGWDLKLDFLNLL